MIAAIGLGAVFTSGCLMAVSAFGVAQPIGHLWAHYTAADSDAAWYAPEEPTPLGFAGAIIEKALTLGSIGDLVAGSHFAHDLAIVGRDLVDFVAHALVKLAIVAALGVTIAATPGFTDSGRIVGIVAAVGVVAVLVDVQRLQNEAKERRSDFLEAVTVFVEFCRLAAHTQSIEGAMRASVRNGATWPFRRLETIFEQADRHRQPPWRAVTALGRRYGMPELVELGSALENAGSEGTRVQDMLAAKATSLRRRMTEDEVQKATSATQRLSIPLGLLGVIFVIVLLAPAVIAY